MQAFLYSVTLWFYKIGIRLASPFNEKAKEFIRGRKETWTRIADFNTQGKQVIWIHCASLGEFEQGRPVIEQLRKHLPEYQILLTFFSPSGFKIRRNYEHADAVLYLPLDSPSNARRWIQSINPSLAIFVKYEFWHYYFHEMQSRNIPIISISSIFRANQIYFRQTGKFYQNILQRVTHFFVQDKESALLLNKTGIEQVTIAGDTRFDRVIEIKNSRKQFPAVAAFAGDQDVLVAGSVWPEDMEVLIPFINTHSLKFIIAPHEISEKFMARIEQETEKKCVRYSQLVPQQADEAEVLIIDNIGMLSSLYGYGRYSWIGGAYGQGLHNILEAAVYGCPLFFGNRNYKKFREARELIKLGSAVAVADYMDLKDQFGIFSQEKTYNIAREINLEYIQSNRGATDMIVRYCLKLLK